MSMQLLYPRVSSGLQYIDRSISCTHGITDIKEWVRRRIERAGARVSGYTEVVMRIL